MSKKLYYFNPTCEMEVVNDTPYYTAPKMIESLKKSLSIVQIFLANEDDYILIDDYIPFEFLEMFTNYGLTVPKVISLKNYNNEIDEVVEFEPWGWSKSVIQKARKFASDNDVIVKENYLWDNDSRKMLSRFSGYELLKIVSNKISNSTNLSIPQLPIVVNKLEELVDIEKEMKTPMLIKTPWSAFGRGLYNIRSNNEKSYESAWVKAKLNEQKTLFVEPLLNKKQDLSFHFYKDGSEISFVGINYFESAKDGKFQGCYVNYKQNPDFNSDIINKDAIDEAKIILLESLKELSCIANYSGYIGIDALFFEDVDGVILLHPAIEMNLRKTMGLVNIFIEKIIDKNSYGFWEIMNRKEYLQHLPHKNSVDSGKLVSGKFNLSPNDENRSVVMLLELV